MAKFVRPTTDFWCTDLKSDLQIVATHTKAGFDPIPDETVRARLFILFEFLYSNGLITAQLASSIEDIKPETALWNRHLTDEGYYFLQKYLPRWQGRLYKHTSALKERTYLARWYEQFRESRFDDA